MALLDLMACLDVSILPGMQKDLRDGIPSGRYWAIPFGSLASDLKNKNIPDWEGLLMTGPLRDNAISKQNNNNNYSVRFIERYVLVK